MTAQPSNLIADYKRLVAEMGSSGWTPGDGIPVLTVADTDENVADSLPVEVLFTSEVNTCWNWKWYIDPARVIVAASGRAPVTVEVDEFASMIGPLVDARRREACAPVDLTVPVLVVELAVPVNGHHRYLIDGWHRIERAVEEGVSTLPAYVLTAEESDQISERDPECNGCGHCGHFPFDPDDAAQRCSRYCAACSERHADDDAATKARKLVGRYMSDPAYRAANPACAFCDADVAVKQAHPDIPEVLVMEQYHEVGCPMNPQTATVGGNRATRRAAAKRQKKHRRGGDGR